MKENAQKNSGDGKNFAMNMIDYDLVFQKGGYADEFPDERKHLYFMLDYAWDIDFISDIVDEYVEEKKEERLEYLRNKAKVCPLDKEERYELNRLEGEY